VLNVNALVSVVDETETRRIFNYVGRICLATNYNWRPNHSILAGAGRIELPTSGFGDQRSAS
jgi:hypothetical protein